MKKGILPIVLDIETSGLDLVKCGIWQIGAIDLNTMEEFFDECKIDCEDEILNLKGRTPVLELIGKREEELRDENKQSQRELLKKFMEWIKGRKMKNFICQNPQFDLAWLWRRIQKEGLDRSFNFRAFDLHSIAQLTFYNLNKNFLIKEDHSDMDLSNILKFCGIEDNRKSHNALEDCKLTGECFSRLIYGKNLFPEFSKYKLPEILKK